MYSLTHTHICVCVVFTYGKDVSGVYWTGLFTLGKQLITYGDQSSPVHTLPPHTPLYLWSSALP